MTMMVDGCSVRRLGVLWACLALCSLAVAGGYDPRQAVAEYQQLLRWRCSPPMELAGPIEIVIDTATFKLESGTFQLMEPIRGEHVTGLSFTGTGRFVMTVPDPIEAVQLARFAQRPGMDHVDQPFTSLALRISDDTLDRLFPSGAPAYGSCPLLEERSAFWIEKLWDDVDSRIIAASLNPGTLAVAADVKTADFGWLTYRHNAADREEISLAYFKGGVTEDWVSLDRPQDRAQNGRPGEALSAPAVVDQIDVTADLTRKGKTGEVGLNYQHTINGHYVVEEQFVPRVEKAGALRLELASSANNVRVFEGGRPVAVLRDHIGARSASIDNRYWDHGMTLLVEPPLAKGETRRFRFEYDFETSNYAPGPIWYPTVPGELHDHVTARLELTVGKKVEVRSMGRLANVEDVENGKRTTWIVDRPAKMLTFSTADHFEEVKLEVPNTIPVIAFSPSNQLGATKKIRNVGADVVNSLQFFQLLFNDKVDAEQLYVTSIAAGHGQAFDGLLHLSEWTFTGEHPGAAELFRAHEVAHQWWGHKVGWKTYRDQWLSESLAEYSAMMFVERFVKGGDKYFDDILRCYESTVLGNFGGGFSKFNRPWLVEFNSAHRARLGPIALGTRASTYEIPDGYEIQAYMKGPLVIHMLRTMLRFKTGSDDLFVKILRDLVHEFAGKELTTEDFRRVVERDAPADWRFFFNAWIYHAEIPNYAWKYAVAPDPAGFRLDVTVKRSGVPADFWSPIPMRIDFEDGTNGVFIIGAQDAESTSTVVLPKRPKKVVFGPEHSALGAVKEL